MSPMLNGVPPRDVDLKFSEEPYSTLFLISLQPPGEHSCITIRLGTASPTTAILILSIQMLVIVIWGLVVIFYFLVLIPLF